MNITFKGADTDLPAGRGFFINGSLAGAFMIEGQYRAARIVEWQKVRQDNKAGLSNRQVTVNHSSVVVSSPNGRATGVATFVNRKWSFTPMALPEAVGFLHRERKFHARFKEDSVIYSSAEKYTDEDAKGKKVVK